MLFVRFYCIHWRHCCTVIQVVVVCTVHLVKLFLIAEHLSSEQATDKKVAHDTLRMESPQGSILAPCLFSIYISDNPTTLSTKLAYADDLALAFTGPDWADVENAMNRDLSTLHTYYHQNRLQLSKEKTMYALHHLNTRDVGRRLHISVDDKTIEFEPNPTYLGVKLDRSLTFKPHLTSVRQKVLSRCALLNRLVAQGGVPP